MQIFSQNKNAVAHRPSRRNRVAKKKIKQITQQFAMLTNDAKMLTLGDQFRASWQRKKATKKNLQNNSSDSPHSEKIVQIEHRVRSRFQVLLSCWWLVVENKHKSNCQKKGEAANHVNGDRFRFKIKMLEIFNHGWFRAMMDYDRLLRGTYA